MAAYPPFRIAAFTVAIFLSGPVHASDSGPVTPEAAPHAFIQLRPSDKAPALCDAVHVGAVAADSDGRLCSCRKLRGVLGPEGTFGWIGVPMGQACGLKAE